MPSGVYIRTKETKKKLSDIMKEKPPFFEGKHHTDATKEKLRIISTGKHPSNKTRKKMSESQKRIGNKPPSPKGKISGEKNPCWKGGITSVRHQIHNNFKYKEWRLQCFKKSNFTCQKCGQSGGKLIVHHKKLFSKLLQEAKKYTGLISLYDACMMYSPFWDVNNGIVLCKKCHRKVKHKWKNKEKKLPQKIFDNGLF